MSVLATRVRSVVSFPDHFEIQASKKGSQETQEASDKSKHRSREKSISGVTLPESQEAEKFAEQNFGEEL